MLTVKPLPAFKDNYIWVLQQDNTPGIVVVDPGDAEPVIERVEQQGLTVDTILITHHHHDHTGGLAKLVERYSPRVIGPNNSRIEGITEPVGEGDTFRLLGRQFEVMETPGHTLDHITFLTPGTPPLLFCGDTLFCGGCGRLFEGTPEDMFKALSRFSELGDDTLVFGAHEYTLANLKFAMAAEPDNDTRDALFEECQKARSMDRPTLPSNIGREKAINPFLRVAEPGVRQAAQAQGDAHDNLATFATLRAWKDNF
ncbi:hydroxyacylglutathione hydrolase [Kushneria phosphatilytica]|uniref:Hydroxyacylglutathione hydrolase n=1 Tax=Kushneria phosphatilytica TaxID=657387 RepID=A0A1S1NSV4_9GAMM|nr:hydroxyacylglutathione hydrolase [Kushneria phosphatilytica]OHV12344.1 hydroxyacylglutathione hydrolase [Kushneria phosphatilytica]QEL11061.1 hydroxyacylglutathione hydrolase [Kushneria phosphatilytica]